MAQDWAQSIALGLPMAVFGMIGGKLGDVLSNLDEPFKSILLVGGITLLSIAAVLVFFALKKYTAKSKAERKESVFTRAAIFGGMGAMLVFVTSPIYSWVNPYQPLACGALGCANEFVWLPFAVSGLFIGVGVFLYFRRR